MKGITKIKKTGKATKSFNAWNENRTPITDEQGNSITVPKNEVFVPLYEYLEKRVKKKYYISNSGRIISFARTDKPKQLRINHSNEYDSIEIYSDRKKRNNSLKLHRAVWFSFAYEYLYNNNTKLKNLAILSFGVDFSRANFKKLLNSDIYKVHHININEKDNRLENLLLLHEEIHNILTQMSRKNDSERYEYFKKNADKFRNKGKMIVIEAKKDTETGMIKGITVSNKLRSNIKIQVVEATLEINEPSIEEMTDFLKKLKEQIKGIKGTNYFDTKKYIIFFNDTDKERIWVYSIFKDVIEKVNLYEYRGEFDISYNYLTNIYYISD